MKNYAFIIQEKSAQKKEIQASFFEYSLTIKDSQNFEYLSVDLVLYFQYLKKPSTLIVEDSLADLSCSITSRIFIDKVLCEYWNQFYGGVLKTPFVIR